MATEMSIILKDVEEKGMLTEENRRKLRQSLGQKFSKAEELIESLAVKKYVFEPSGKIVWIIVGREKEYFVIPNIYCQCDDFYINVVIRKKVDYCYHMIAQAIAERITKYECFIVPDSDFIRLNSEWKKQSI